MIRYLTVRWSEYLVDYTEARLHRVVEVFAVRRGNLTPR